MKMLLKPVLLAGLSLAASSTLVAAPAAAQVNGIATSSVEAALVKSAAFQSGYQAIGAANATQRQQAATLRTEIGNLQATLDTNGDGLTQEEWNANPGVNAQITAKEQQIQTLLTPGVIAEHYVIEQLLMRYGAAQEQVITSNNIQLMLDPTVLQYSADQVDVTDKIVAQLNTLVPTVTTTPPANWQPRRQTAEVHQSVQQLIIGIAQRQAIQAAQQQQNQQPSGR